MCRIDDNALRSTLHINNITPSDFAGKYACWIQNKYAALNPARILILRRRRKLNYSHVVTDFSAVSFCCIKLVLNRVVLSTSYSPHFPLNFGVGFIQMLSSSHWSLR